VTINPTKFIETQTWTLPVPGEYIVSALVTLVETGETISAGNVLLEVEAPPLAPASEEGG